MTTERRPEGFHSAKQNPSLCSSLTTVVVRNGWTAKSPSSRISTQDASAASGHLQGTMNVSVMGPRDGDGNEHTVIHQPSMASVPFRYIHPHTATHTQSPSWLTCQAYTQHWAPMLSSSIYPFKRHPISAAKVPLYTFLQSAAHTMDRGHFICTYWREMLVLT